MITNVGIAPIRLDKKLAQAIQIISSNIKSIAQIRIDLSGKKVTEVKNLTEVKIGRSYAGKRPRLDFNDETLIKEIVEVMSRATFPKGIDFDGKVLKISKPKRKKKEPKQKEIISDTNEANTTD